LLRWHQIVTQWLRHQNTIIRLQRPTVIKKNFITNKNLAISQNFGDDLDTNWVAEEKDMSNSCSGDKLWLLQILHLSYARGREEDEHSWWWKRAMLHLTMSPLLCWCKEHCCHGQKRRHMCSSAGHLHTLRFAPLRCSYIHQDK